MKVLLHELLFKMKILVHECGKVLLLYHIEIVSKIRFEGSFFSLTGPTYRFSKNPTS